MVGPLQVEDIMNKTPPMIGQTKTLSDARKLLSQLESDYLFVTVNNEPTYVLDDVIIYTEKPDTLISDILEKLDEVQSITFGTSLEYVDKMLQTTPALIVRDENHLIRGSISQKELWREFSKQAKMK